MATNEELTLKYQQLRERCIAIGRSLTAEQAEIMTPCCPEWSVRGLFAHMAGVPVDILEGNLENAATAEWADAQVERRADDSLVQILDEWQSTADQIDSLLSGMALEIDPRFFLDCWTHEWDLRQALDLAMTPDVTLPAMLLAEIVDRLDSSEASQGLDPVTLAIETPEGVQRFQLGSGESTAELSMSLFEFSRMVVGRRSASQIAALGASAKPAQLIYFSPASTDIVDPVLA